MTDPQGAALGARLNGWKVLVPRQGKLGARLAESLQAAGAEATIAPVIAFAPTSDRAGFAERVQSLADGGFDWLAITSATTVRILEQYGARVPASTRVAAVGESTAEALRQAGFRVDYVPSEHSAEGLLAEWPSTITGGEARQRVFLPQSAIADPSLAAGLREQGLQVETFAAYSTGSVALPQRVVERVAAGGFDAVVLTSGSIAAEVSQQLGALPEGMIVACIGAKTARAARDAGLAVAAVAKQSNVESLVGALATARAT